MFEKILVAYDGLEGSKKALDVACDLALNGGARLTAVAVLEHLPKYAASVGEIEETAEQGRAFLSGVLAEAQAQAAARGVGLAVDQVAGQPAEALVRYAREHGHDLMVFGHTGHSGIWGTFLGTTPDKAVRHAHCSVLVVR